MTEHVVVAIHGVGNHAEGRIKGTLHASLEPIFSNAQFDEFNWATIATNHNRADSLEDMARDLHVASELGFCGPAKRYKFAASMLGRFHNFLMSIVNFLLGLGIGGIFCTPALMIVTSFIILGATDLSISDFRWPLGPFVDGLKFLAIPVGIALSVATLAGMVPIWQIERLGADRLLFPLTLILRRIVLLLAARAVTLVTIFLRGDFWRVSATFILTVTSIFMIAIPFAGILAILSPEGDSPAWSDFLDVTVLAASIWLGVGLGFVTASVAGRFWENGPLRVYLDVLRYLGNPDYRAKILGGLDLKIRSLRARNPRSHIILVTHSLGSIIALDSLLNSHTWRSVDRVTLVTMGSPLRRCLFRFFPHFLFPPSVPRILSMLRQRQQHFEWVNLYRPLDYIGGRVGLRRAFDRSTRQWGKILSSHSNYWSDPRVVALIRELVADSEVQPKMLMSNSSRTHWRPDQPSMSATAEAETLDYQWLSSSESTQEYWIPSRNGSSGWDPSLRHGVTTLLMLVAIFVLSWVGLTSAVVDARSVRDSKLNDRLATLSTIDQSASASVTHDPFSWYYKYSGVSHGEFFTFHFSDHLGNARVVKIEFGENNYFGWEDLLFSPSKLRSHIRERCGTTDPSAPCTRDGISIRFNPADTSVLQVPLFPPDPPQSTVGQLFGVLTRNPKGAALYLIVSFLVSLWAVSIALPDREF
jgi:hypothetical protein